MRWPGLLAYAAMGMWLLQLAVTPVRAAQRDDIVFSRAGNHVEAIRAALVAHGADASVKVTLAAPETVIPLTPDGSPAFDSISRNPVTGRFFLRIRGAPGAPAIVVAGVAMASVALPVPARAIERGETIGEDDIEWLDVADTRAASHVEDPDAIIGKIARRPLAAGAPFRPGDLTSPILVKRGAGATIVFEAPGIRLTQVAIALSNASAGDLIAFRNIASDREIKAVVVGENLAKAPSLASASFESKWTNQ